MHHPEIDFQAISYFAAPKRKQTLQSLDEVDPELLRTWDPKTHNGAIFVNFNTVQDKPWVFEPGGKYARNYRVFVYDGHLSTQDAERLWQAYRAATR